MAKGMASPTANTVKKTQIIISIHKEYTLAGICPNLRPEKRAISIILGDLKKSRIMPRIKGEGPGGAPYLVVVSHG
jgi:hypothetical protein